MTLNDLFKYATERIVMHLDKPKEERLALKQARKEERPLLLTHMFGTIPLALKLLLKSKKSK